MEHKKVQKPHHRRLHPKLVPAATEIAQRLRILKAGAYVRVRLILRRQVDRTQKRHDYVAGRTEIGASPEDVGEEMNELLLELHSVEAKNALTAAAYFHVKFENIHPFADGNGRAGRLAMNYLLLLLDHPPVIIHEEERKDYYAALEAWDTAQDLDRMKEFLQEQTVKTWQKQLAKNERKHEKER